ncbi:PR-1-like protein [Mycena crocata]|nr:PR-1-like protein [Mycena crocata]
MARLFSLAVLIALLPSGLAGPACAQRHKNASDCMLRCNTKWGFPGLMMGNDPWGNVAHLAGKSGEEWDMYVAKACGQESATTSSTASETSSSATAQETKLIHQGLQTQSEPSTTSSIRSTSSSRATTSSTTSRLTTSTRRTTSTPRPTTTSTSTKERTTTKETPKETPTTTKETPKETPTKESQSSSFTGDNGDDNNDDNSNKASSNSNSNSGGSGSRASLADQQAYLDAHNSIRAKHGAKPLVWDNNAAEKAQQWADLCKNQHSGGTLGPLGENLAAGTGSFSIAEAVKAWTDEVTEYNPNNPQPSHFTQVVWKASTKLGCAVQTCDGIFAGFGAAQYYVCEYSEQGNVIGNFGANVQA